jgi:hypothetical protein
MLSFGKLEWRNALAIDLVSVMSSWLALISSQIFVDFNLFEDIL